MFKVRYSPDYFQGDGSNSTSKQKVYIKLNISVVSVIFADQH